MLELTTLPTVKHTILDEERFIQVETNNKERVIRNNLYLITCLNFITILLFIFSMSYFHWIRIDIVLNNKHKNIWMNLLYVAYEGKYLSYGEAVEEICG